MLGGDDSQDGEYIIKVVAADKAGNKTEVPIEVSFLYDNVAPKLDSLRPTQSDESFNFVDNTVGETIYYNLPITGFVAEFEDAGIGVDLTGRQQSTHIVFGTPKESGDGLNVRGGRALPDSDDGTLTYVLNVLNAPIVSRDGSQDGRYTLNVRATDALGNTKIYNYQLIYDTQLPTLVSTTPASNETVSELSQVQVKLDEVTSGIDFVESTFQLTRDGMLVPVNVTSNGIDTATLTLTKPIALDGSEDGTYTIEVTPADRAGNTSVAVVREFYLVSQKHEPEVRLTMPQTTTVNSLPTVAVELIDYVGAGIDFDASTVTVRNPEGALVSQEELEHDEASNLLTWTTEASVAPDGSEDGEYTITATFVDFTGRSFTRQFLFVLDTQIPELVSTVPAANETVSELSQVEVKLSEVTSGIDFLQSTFRLTRFDETASGATGGGANGEDEAQTTGGGGAQVNVPVNITSNGTDTVILTLAEPIALDGSDDGTYAIEVSPTDRAGNTGVAVVREFYLVSQKHEPEIRLTMPETTTVNSLPTIVVELIDYVGAGIDFDASTVAITNSQGVLIPQEELEHDEASSLLTWTTEASVAPDGSEDGEYTITATFVDFTGRSFTRQFLFVLDTHRCIPALVSTVPTARWRLSQRYHRFG